MAKLSDLLDEAAWADRDFKIVVTGHSNGAGVSNLAALDIALRFADHKDKIWHLPFASPNAGNEVKQCFQVPNIQFLCHLSESLGERPLVCSGVQVALHLQLTFILCMCIFQKFAELFLSNLEGRSYELVTGFPKARESDLSIEPDSVQNGTGSSSTMPLNQAARCFKYLSSYPATPAASRSAVAVVALPVSTF